MCSTINGQAHAHFRTNQKNTYLLKTSHKLNYYLVFLRRFGNTTLTIEILLIVDADIGDKYFIKELLGCKIYDADTNDLLGTVKDVTNAPANDVWHIINEKGEYLVPAIDDVVVSVDVEKCIGFIRPLKGIFDDED